MYTFIWRKLTIYVKLFSEVFIQVCVVLEISLALVFEKKYMYEGLIIEVGAIVRLYSMTSYLHPKPWLEQRTRRQNTEPVNKVVYNWLHNTLNYICFIINKKLIYPYMVGFVNKV